MVKNVFVSLTVCCLLWACSKKTDDSDPKLLGTWTDDNVNYTFYDSKKYGVKYLRKGAGADTVTTDSAYGDYIVDAGKKIISFELKAVIAKDNTIKEAALKASTWNYEISNDTLLEYNSSTARGELVRVPIK